MYEKKYLASQKRYHKENTQLFTIRLMKVSDQDIIEKLDSVPNKSGYVKDLIRKDIKKGKRKPKQEENP